MSMMPDFAVRVDTAHIDNLGIEVAKLSGEVSKLTQTVDRLMSAISMSHDRESATDPCSPTCWSCRIEDLMRGIAVSDVISETGRRQDNDA